MSVLKVLTYPNPILQRVSKPVKEFNQELRELAENMVETMEAENGIGLAAPQVGKLLQLIVVRIPKENDEPGVLYTVCNPKIAKGEGKTKIEEGCLSLPGFYVEVDRFEKITLEGRNLDGSPFSLEADGLLAICFQHEMDHLNGKLLVHYVSQIKRSMYKKEVEKQARENLLEDSRPSL